MMDTSETLCYNEYMKINDTSIRNKEWAVEQYVLLQKSIHQIRRETGLGYNTIKRWLHRYGIIIRQDDEIVRNQKSLKLTNNPHWKGKRNNNGYKYIYYPKHPLAPKSGYINEHRFILEQSLGRILEPEEWVHHIDMDKVNNNLTNLIICTQGEHKKAHASLQRLCAELLQRRIIYFDRKEKVYGLR